MLRVAVSQLTTHFRRFVAIGLAVMLSVMFLSATLMVGASTNASLGASIGESYRNADLVASSRNGEAFTQAAVDAAVSAPSVEDSYAERSTYVMFEAGGGEQYGRLRNAAPASLEGAVLKSGSMPSKASEAVIDVKTAEHLGLSVGSMLELRGAGPVKTAKVSITGLIQATNDPFSSSAAQLVASDAVLNAVQDAGAGFTGVQFSLKSGEDAAAAKEYITHRMEAAGAASPVLETAQEKVTSTVAMLSAGQDQLTIVLLAFAGVAILVSTLVVANTFSVLVAQRTRELALLRCLGAGRGQIRGSVMLEALVVGFLSSVLGVLAAAGLMTGLIAWARSQPEQAFATLAVPPSAIVAGLVAGTVLTVVAALVPAKAATAVAPLAALRPSDDASVRNKRGKVRLVLGLVTLLGGAAALAYGSVNVSLGVALLGGAASFVGILLCSTLFIPTVVAVAGRLAAPAGVPGKLAAVNATRNPARTSATAAALLIGVTLVSLMMTGAATSRQAFNDTLAENYPVDLSAQTAVDGSGDHDQALARIKGLDGVSAAVLLEPVGTLSDTTTPDGGQTIYGISAADAAEVLRDNNLKPGPGTLYLPEDSPEGPASIATAAGSVSLDAKVLRTRHVPAFVESSSIPASPLPETASMVWVKLDDSVSTDRVQALQKDIAAALGVQERTVSGAAIERVTFNSIIDVLLLVVTGLLGVAVVIALIGVANTLSLSVLERTRENSLLRALGLTKGQLRGMLAIEAALVAGVAAIMGAGMGIVYGWLGAQATLGGVASVVPAVPWLQLAAVFGVAVVAGLLASVIPARRAARLSPVEGLATA
ncbi:putative ABC transport system permease protein [Paenarthrobacter nicotinovorans]|uniref:ABC transporter permease n=1 Tax=Micrococcaceae TaxID=1268 RepID=UPI0008771A39|nr:MULTISPECIES: ABC transporter permease [Micrococcaceae]MDR6435988.1 putative ABC transport system permease protein [Paenarthrobacter nicotinovorans]SCZ51295.1 putative ABC transport system permease protein [Arthrobacter sp. UNCCL28]